MRALLVLPLLLACSSSQSNELETESKDILSKKATAITKASLEVAPAVVSITVISTKIVEEFHPFLNDPFWRELIPPSYSIRKVRSMGSGVVVSEDGYVITNEHVVGEEPDSIIITFPDGQQFSARYVYALKDIDIAVLKIDAKAKFPYAKLGNSDSLVVGEWVVAIGNPLAYYLENTEPTITAGIVSGLRRSIKGNLERIYKNMIQTDAAINPGNSGGPLVDMDGKVVGINTFIFSRSGGFEGIGFAIPINTVKKVLEEVRKYGKVRKGYLPVKIQMLTPELKQAIGYEGLYGVLIVSSKLKEIKEGDIVVSINGVSIKNLGDWESMTYFLIPGEKLYMKLYRKGRYLEVPITVPEYKEILYESRWGMVLAETDEGIFVRKVFYNTLASFLGFEEGDKLLEINGRKVKTLEDFKQLEEIVMKTRRIYGKLLRGGSIVSFSIVF